MSQYFRLRDTDVHRTWTVDRGTLVDIDVDGHPVGIEILADEVQMVDFVEVLLAIADRAVIPVHDGPLDEIDESEDREAGLGRKSENRGWSGHRLTVSGLLWSPNLGADVPEFHLLKEDARNAEIATGSVARCTRVKPDVLLGPLHAKHAQVIGVLCDECFPEQGPESLGEYVDDLVVRARAEPRNGPRRLMPSERTDWMVQCKQCGESYDMSDDAIHVCS